MIRINLLPVREFQRKRIIQKELGVAGFSLILTLSIIFLSHLFLSKKVKEIDLQITSTNSELKKLEKKGDELKEFEVKKALLEKRLGVINTLQKNRVGSAYLMDEIQKDAPSGLWLTDLSENNGVLDLKGNALSESHITQFMRNLENTPYFKEMKLVIIQNTEKEGLTLKNFNITLKIVFPT